MKNSTKADTPAEQTRQMKGTSCHRQTSLCHLLTDSLCNIKCLLILASVLACISACNPKTATLPLPLEPPGAFSHRGEAERPIHWWTAFEDDQLNTLVEQALDSNFTIQTAWFRLQSAEAVVERESSFLLPSLDATLQAATNYPQPDFVGGENIRFGLSAVYEVDLWGRIRSQVAAAGFRAESSLFDYQAAALSLSAEIGRSWYQLLAARQQLALIQAQTATNEKILELIIARFGIGQIRAVDVLRQKQLVAATKEQGIYAESRVETLEHQLAVLLGTAPQQPLLYQADSLPQLPPLPQTGIPAELVRRRPDVQASFKLLQAADREVAATISNQYPRFAISASPSVRANNAETLFQDWAYSLAGNLAAPLFYGGRLRAEVNRAKAFRNQLLYEWGQTVLIAFQEVEDALVLEQKQQEALVVLEEQLVLARQTSEQLRVEYFNGFSDYLAVLTALNQEQQLRRDVISARLGLLEYRIALYRALAGGFATARGEER